MLVRESQRENMPSIYPTLDVLKCDTSRVVSCEQEANMSIIFVTFDVSK